MRSANRKSNTMLKLTVREIKSTFGRFFAVFAIIALGTGFFSGVRITTPVMVHSVDEYYRENRLYDYRAISTMGWEESEVTQLSEKSEVDSAEGSWQYDVICEAQDGSVGVYKVHSITQKINGLQLEEGRMPKSKTECLIDSRNRMGLALGDSIRFSADNDADTLEAFSETTYTVVGFIKSSLYINFERGTTSIGNGTVLGFLYVPKQTFCADYYTDIYMKLDDDPVIYSDEYENKMDKLRPEWEELIQIAADSRYDRVYTDAKQELFDARTEFEDKKSEGEQELADAAKELADGKKELDDAEKELADGKKELDDAEKELADGKKELDDAEKELADGKKELDDAEKELADGKKELDRNAKTLADAKKQLDSSAGQLRDGERELLSGAYELADAEARLDDAWAQLEDGRVQLEDAEAELNIYAEQISRGREELDYSLMQLQEADRVLRETDSELEAASVQLDDAKNQLNETGIQLAQTEEQLSEGQAELDARQLELDYAAAMGLLDEDTLAAAQAEISAARAVIDDSWQQYNAGMAAYRAGLAEYEAKEAEYYAGRQAYEAGLSDYQNAMAEYEAGVAAYEQGLAEYDAGQAAYEQAVAEYNSGLADYEEGVKQYNEGVDTYNRAVREYNEGLDRYHAGLAEYNEGKDLYDRGVADYESGMRTYQEAKEEYEKGKADYRQGTADYEEGLREYEDGLAEYKDGVKEYEDAKKTFDDEISDAEQKLRDAEADLDELEEPDTYLLERTSNIGYACFETDSQIVEQIARVLPIFFILVAILVCMTTMTRMVDERRGQIGVLKGLGYTRREIMVTFLAYSGIAAVLGCIIGYTVGILLFPTVIWYAYEMMYINIPLRFIVDRKLAAAIFLVSMVSTLGTTYLSCRSELSEPAASLMRPKAPKAGKRVFLEYFPAIWNRLKFMHKVSIRNIFRYKKRFFMMVVGISGCTALLVTGFGLKDSIATFVDAQYDNIQVAQVELFTEEIRKNEIPDDLKQTIADTGASVFFYQQSAWDLQTEKRVRGVTVIAPADWSKIDSFFRLHTMDGKRILKAERGKALISISVAEHYGLKAGDEILLRNEDMQTVRAVVSDVFENHVYDYVILSRETMEDAVEDYYINGAYVNYPEGTDIYKAQASLADCDSVITVSVFSDFRERIANMMSSLNYVVLLIIMSAAALAFVVLYNLTNINIIERTREIATIKVLGFYRQETSAYVFRENMFLTSIGMLAGLGLGVLLHSFIIDQIVVDLVYFKKEITPLSFLLSIFLTFFFTFLVNRIMTFKLDKINMAESLKSVD